jgi:hypothetical protein
MRVEVPKFDVLIEIPISSSNRDLTVAGVRTLIAAKAGFKIDDGNLHLIVENENLLQKRIALGINFFIFCRGT